MLSCCLVGYLWCLVRVYSSNAAHGWRVLQRTGQPTGSIMEPKHWPHVSLYTWLSCRLMTIKHEQLNGQLLLTHITRIGLGCRLLGCVCVCVFYWENINRIACNYWLCIYSLYIATAYPVMYQVCVQNLHLCERVTLH